jgi:hypothetical protein
MAGGHGCALGERGVWGRGESGRVGGGTVG